MAGATLDAFLGSYAGPDDRRRADVAEIVRGLANAAVALRAVINQGALAGGERMARPGAGGEQRDLDVYADEAFLGAMRGAPVAAYCSEELDTAVLLNARHDLGVSIDPLDGSSNIEANVSIGTIFSVLPVAGDVAQNPAETFLQPGRRQVAAGFFIYGPQLALALTVGSGTHIFVFSQRLGTFVQAHESRVIPPRTSEFALNASNYRHWQEPVRLYFDDCLKGSDGPRARDFTLRWIASLVADTYRILTQGGVFLSPGDQRKGHANGRLRLVSEANPIAMLIEQAGGAATDTVGDILDRVPESLQQRVPLVFGAANEVAEIARYHTEPSSMAERAPLFGTRGLFRA